MAVDFQQKAPTEITMGKGMLFGNFGERKVKIPAKKPKFWRFWPREGENLTIFVEKFPTRGTFMYRFIDFSKK